MLKKFPQLRQSNKATQRKISSKTICLRQGVTHSNSQNSSGLILLNPFTIFFPHSFEMLGEKKSANKVTTQREQKILLALYYAFTNPFFSTRLCNTEFKLSQNFRFDFVSICLRQLLQLLSAMFLQTIRIYFLSSLTDENFFLFLVVYSNLFIKANRNKSSGILKTIFQNFLCMRQIFLYFKTLHLSNYVIFDIFSYQYSYHYLSSEYYLVYSLFAFLK